MFPGVAPSPSRCALFPPSPGPVGGPVPRRCPLPWVRPDTRFYYDPDRDGCVPFLHPGCGADSAAADGRVFNQFGSYDDCMNSCIARSGGVGVGVGVGANDVNVNGILNGDPGSTVPWFPPLAGAAEDAERSTRCAFPYSKKLIALYTGKHIECVSAPCCTY